VTEQWTTEWSCIVNAVFRIVKNHSKKVTFLVSGVEIAPIAPLDPPLLERIHKSYSFSENDLKVK